MKQYGLAVRYLENYSTISYCYKHTDYLTCKNLLYKQRSTWGVIWFQFGEDICRHLHSFHQLPLHSYSLSHNSKTLIKTIPWMPRNSTRFNYDNKEKAFCIVRFLFHSHCYVLTGIIQKPEMSFTITATCHHSKAFTKTVMRS